MLNLALVALLSGSLFVAPDGDCKKERTCERDQAPVALESAVGVDDIRAITGDTYAFGRPADSAPIKLWVEYARGSTEKFYSPGGTATDLGAKLNAQRVAVGLQLNVINFSSFKFGFGGQLNVAQDKVEIGGTTVSESAFGLQGVKIFGALRGRVVGVHGGYMLDLADGPDASATRSSSDQRDAIFFGGDFDYPSDRFRLFGGVDFFMPQTGDVVVCTAPDCSTTATMEDDTSDNILVFTMGAGIRFSVFELGTAVVLRAQEDRGFVNESGSHHGSLSPYLRISPPSIPVSLFVQGSVAREYADYGVPLGGGNDIRGSYAGFTAGLTIGFE